MLCALWTLLRQTQDNVSKESRECRWVFLKCPQIKDTVRLCERLWYLGNLCNPHLYWMATNWSEEREDDEDEEEAAAAQKVPEPEDEEDAENDDRDEVKQKLVTHQRMTRRKVKDDAVCIMYFTYPVIIKLLRKHVDQCIPGCTIEAVVRGKGDPFRMRISKVLPTGTGLAELGQKKDTPFVCNLTREPRNKYSKHD